MVKKSLSLILTMTSSSLDQLNKLRVGYSSLLDKVRKLFESQRETFLCITRIDGLITAEDLAAFSESLTANIGGTLWKRDEINEFVSSIDLG